MADALAPQSGPAPGAPGADAVVVATGLRAGYGEIDVLQQVSVEVRRGELVSLIGPNGAGKSTVLKTIMGFLRPRAGRVVFDGQDVTGWRPDRVVRRGLAYVPQGRIVFQQMTVQENLEMGAFAVADGARARATLERMYTLFPRLAERRAQRAGTMSGGEQQMLAIARGLMIEPRALLLDEPSLGLSPLFVDLVFDKIAELRAAGMTLLMVEQNAARALELSDRGYVLELGRNRFEGPGPALLADPRVRQLYLGG
ncbi:MAG TPA: ABC transporter ATP-binding protein [Chloroflexota bacterium]|nr:ABC transporter ATP-binding protein [Chloroflexota bacterium]